MKAIVTGGTGLIGSTFCEKYQSQFDAIYQLGRSRADLEAEWIQYDLSSGECLRLPEVDVLFHFAGQTSNSDARKNVLNDLSVNVIGTIQILQALKNNSKRPFVVFAGTATEFGHLEESTPVNEQFCSNPQTFYDISKLTAENYLLQFVREGWINGCSLRLSNVFGANHASQKIDRGVIDRVFLEAINGEAISVYGSGNYLRDYIHVEDVVTAFFDAWKHSTRVNGEFYNIGTGVGTTVLEAFRLVSELAKEVSDVDVGLSFVDPPGGLSLIERRSYVADNKKFMEATGWSPQYNLETGLRHTYSNFFKNAKK